MSWRELAWSGMMRRKQAGDESTGLVTSVDLQTGTPAAAATRRTATTTALEGLQVTVDTLKPTDDGRSTRVGRMRLGG